MKSIAGFDECSVFTYLIAPKEINDFSKHVRIHSAESLVLNCTKKTEFLLASEGNEREIIIVGFCVDAHGEYERKELPKEALRSSKDIDELLNYSRRFAGNYVIVYSDYNGTYIFTDCIGAMKVNYHKQGIIDGGGSWISSSEYIISLYCPGISENKYAERIMDEANTEGYQLPYDLTFFNDVFHLLPNHFYSISNNKVERYWPQKGKRKSLNVNYVINKTEELAGNIIHEYEKAYNLVVPITGGNDSRVVFALTHKYGKQNRYYTFYNDDLSETDSDITIPREIAKDYNLNYHLVTPEEASESFNQYAKKYFDRYSTPLRIRLAWTFLGNFTDNEATVNGNILEEMGRNMTGGRCPDRMALPELSMNVAHNYSNGAQAEFAKQYKKIRSDGYGDKLLDIISWENVCGCWVSDSMNVYFLSGCNALNICNCREIIEMWTDVSKKERCKKRIHNGLIMAIEPALNNYPYNQSKQNASIWSKMWFFSLLSSNKQIRALLGFKH